MKSVVFKQKGEPLSIEERPLPQPGPHQLLVRVRAVGICGSDLHASAADWTPTGIVMGHEFAGEVAAVGAKATSWKVGDRVVPMPTISCGECGPCQAGDFDRCQHLATLDFSPDHPGAYAEYTLVGAHNTLRLPEGISFEEAAAVEPLAVGYDAVRRARLRPDDAVLIVGAGPIGLAIAQWCRHFGMTDVVVSEMNPARLALAQAMGATATIDAGRDRDAAAAFERLTGRPPTLLFEAVGVPGMIQRCIEMAPPDGRIVVVGVCMKTDSFEPMQCIAKRLSLAFTLGYSLADYATILKLMAQGRIVAKPLVSHRIPLDELPAMFERMRQPTDQIKVIVQP